MDMSTGAATKPPVGVHEVSVKNPDGSTIEYSDRRLQLSRRDERRSKFGTPGIYFAQGIASRCVNAVKNSERSRYGTNSRRDPADTAVKLDDVTRRAIT